MTADRIPAHDAIPAKNWRRGEWFWRCVTCEKPLCIGQALAEAFTGHGQEPIKGSGFLHDWMSREYQEAAS
jgi:hypothetical protein